MTLMKPIFTLLVLRFGRFAVFGYRRQRRMLRGNGSFPESMRTKNGARCIGNSVSRNGSFRNSFKSFAETFSGRHCRSAGIPKHPKQLVGISVGEKANPQMSSDFSLFIQSTTAAFPSTGFPARLFPSPLSALFGNFYPVWRSA